MTKFFRGGKDALIFAEDVIWVSPVGAFKGKEVVKCVLTWDTQISPVEARRSCASLSLRSNPARIPSATFLLRFEAFRQEGGIPSPRHP